MFGNKVTIPKFGKIRTEFKCLKGQGKNSNVWKDKARIPMLGGIRSEFECLEE